MPAMFAAGGPDSCPAGPPAHLPPWPLGRSTTSVVDRRFIAAAGIPTVMLGPGGAGAHAAEEWVSVSDTRALARTLVAVAERVCA